MKSQSTDTEEGTSSSTAVVAEMPTAAAAAVIEPAATTLLKKKEKTLTAGESKLLAQNEAVIKQGLGTFFEVGRALLEIRDNKLYRGAKYRTFESYCREKWGFSKSHANRLIGGAEIVDVVSSNDTSHAPISETHVRPLIGLPAYQQRKVWKRALEKAGGNPDAVRAKDVVEIGRELGLIKLEGSAVKVGGQKHASAPARANLVRRDDILEVLEVWVKNHSGIFRKNSEPAIDELRREINDL